MPLTIHTLKEQEKMQKQGEFLIADRRLYLTSDKKQVVEEGDPRGAWLYASPGTRIPLAFARDHGLLTEASGPKEKAVDKSEKQDKAVRQSTTRNKGGSKPASKSKGK